MERRLSDSIQLGNLVLKNRIVLAALTRMRTNPATGVPNDLMLEYYTQRAGAGLVLTEASAIHPRGEAFPGAGNLYNQDHVAGWKKIVDSVHSKGAKMFAQLVHAGRNTHPKFNSGLEIWAPSAVGPRGRIPGSQMEFQAPKREMTLEEIEELKGQFLNSFKLAKEAGFDGVQVHGANGYIVDEFIRSFSNRRTDKYGGSAENRCRLALEVIDLALTVFPKEQVSIKLSPVGRYGDMFDENPIETYTYLVQQLNKRGIGSIEWMRSVGEYVSDSGNKFPTPTEQLPDVLGAFRPYFSGYFIGNQGYNPEEAERDVRQGLADMISFGKLFISNPDLNERIFNKWELNPAVDYSTWFTGGAKGYTDYPVYSGPK